MARRPSQPAEPSGFDDIKKFLAFDEAVAKLKEAGLDERFITAIENDQELMNAVENIAPRSRATLGNQKLKICWSCCITVNDPTVQC